MYVTGVESTYAQGTTTSGNNSNVDVEKQYFFDVRHRIDNPPNSVNIGGASISDQIIEPNTIWNEKKTKDDETNSNNDPNNPPPKDVDEIKPVELDNQVVRMLPEQAMRALIDGDFILESIRATGEEGGLVSHNLGMNWFSSTGKGMFYAQDIAAGRLLAAYEAYGALADTQLYGGGFADKEALASLNSCIYNHIKKNKSSWIAAMYHCMGEGDPQKWKTTMGGGSKKSVKDLQKVDIRKKDDTSGTSGAVPKVDPWLARIKERFSNGDSKILLTDFLFKTVKDGTFTEDGDLGNIKKNWLDWYGDYELKFEGENGGDTEAFGHQTTNIRLIPIQPNDEKTNNGGGQSPTNANKKSKNFTKKFEEIFTKRCNNFKDLWVELCVNNFKNNGEFSTEKVKAGDDKAFWNLEKNNTSVGSSGKTKKDLIWNLTDQRVIFSTNFMEGVQVLLKNLKESQLKIDGQCKDIIENGMSCNNITDDENADNVANLPFRYARSYVKFLANSQLLHAIQVSQQFVFFRAADITDLGNEIYKMAINLIEKATGVNNVEMTISKNVHRWRKLIKKVSAAVTHQSADKNAITSGN